MPHELSQTEKDKSHVSRSPPTMCFHLHVESKEQNKANGNRLIETENRPMVARGWGGVEG